MYKLTYTLLGRSPAEAVVESRRRAEEALDDISDLYEPRGIWVTEWKIEEIEEG